MSHGALVFVLLLLVTVPTAFAAGYRNWRTLPTCAAIMVEIALIGAVLG